MNCDAQSREPNKGKLSFPQSRGGRCRAEDCDGGGGGVGGMCKLQCGSPPKPRERERVAHCKAARNRLCETARKSEWISLLEERLVGTKRQQDSCRSLKTGASISCAGTQTVSYDRILPHA